jgi:hypothetical protein
MVTPENVEYFDPDMLPELDIFAARNYEGRPASWLAQKAEHTRFEHFYATNQEDITGNLGRLLMGDALDATARQISYRGGICVPIGEKETIKTIEPTFDSIRATTSDAREPVLVLAWLNYSVDRRRDVARLADLRFSAMNMAVRIEELMAGDPADTVRARTAIVIDELREGEPRISGIRQSQLLTMAGLSRRQSRRFSDDPDVAYVRPEDFAIMFCDADSELSSNAWGAARESLLAVGSLFVNGTLHYTGGVFDMSPAELAMGTADDKLTYLTEMLRRAMIDHLPATANRGYLPETGLAAKLGVLVTLGGFNTQALDNESYWLQRAAVNALKPYYAYRPHPRGTSESASESESASLPYVNGAIADRIQSIARYEKYLVRSSGRGIEHRVRSLGRNALVGFDQNQHLPYRLWSHMNTGAPVAHRDEPFTTQEACLLLDAVYSYFKDYGGQLRVEDIRGFNALLGQVLRADAPCQPWLPMYIPKELRPAASGS